MPESIDRLRYLIPAARTRKGFDTVLRTCRLIAGKYLSVVIIMSESGNDLRLFFSTERTRAYLKTDVLAFRLDGGHPFAKAVNQLRGLHLKGECLPVYFFFSGIFVNSRRRAGRGLNYLTNVKILIRQRGEHIYLLVCLVVFACTFKLTVSVLGRHLGNEPFTVAMLKGCYVNSKCKRLTAVFVGVYVCSCLSAFGSDIIVIVINVVELGKLLSLDMDLITGRTFPLEHTALVGRRLVGHVPITKLMHVYHAYKEFRERVNLKAKCGSSTCNGIDLYNTQPVLLINALVIGGEFLYLSIVKHMVDDKISVSICRIDRDRYGKALRVIVIVRRQISNAYIHKLYSVYSLYAVSLCPYVGIVIHFGVNYNVIFYIVSKDTGDDNAGLFVIKLLKT